jgi:hypothetical protein
MVKFLKEKKVVIILNGRYAGKKAVIVETFEKYVRCVLLYFCLPVSLHSLSAVFEGSD